MSIHPHVTWIPAHPVYGSVSMRRYWQALHENIRPDDPFSIHSVMRPQDMNPPPGWRGTTARFYQRRFGYPLVIRRNFRGEIGHVLDHSWADMLPCLPPGTRKVVTVHDLIPLRFPGELSRAQTNRFQSWVSYLRHADAVIAVSAYTKSEVVDLLGISGEKIHVVPNGVDMPPVDPSLNRKIAQSESTDFRIGSIGSTLLRKNLGILPAALADLVKRIGRKVVLVRAGEVLPEDLAKEIHSVLGPDGLVEMGRLPDGKLAEFYASLDVMVVPSLYEGFGLPVIEAMAARVPVAASRCSSLPEVGGNHALYFDPHAPEQLAAVLAQVALQGVSDSDLEEARERARDLSWRKCLEGVYRVYDDVLRRKEKDAA